MGTLTIGATAPDFSLPAADGSVVTLSTLRGGPVIVYFYPAAMTPGCTRQACDFRDSWQALLDAGYQVLGISPDPVAKLQRFAERDQLPFPLLSDTEHTVMERWGAWGEKKLYGKTVVGVIRSTVVVDAVGVVTWVRYGVKATGHVALLRRELGT